MKNIYIIFLIAISFGISNNNYSVEQDSENRILWSSTQKLKWDDFKGIPPSDRFIKEAVIQCEIAFIEESSNVNVGTFFVKNKSWTITDNIITLEHEQLHFDIYEVYTRKIRQCFDSLNQKGILNSEMYQKCYDDFVQESIERNTLYDSEVYFNEQRQKEWEEMIRLELEELKEFEYIP